MRELFIESPLVLLFVVAAVGYLVGKISIKGISLGVAAILFVGLGFGAIFPGVQIPSILYQLGVVIFVYSVGISSGPAFFSSIKNNGSRDIVFGTLMLTLSATLAVGIFYLFDLDAATTVGIYTGSSTNTPALAGVIEQINQSKVISNKDQIIQLAVVAYSFTYPLGIISSLVAILVMEKVFKINYNKEKQELRKIYPVAEDLKSLTAVVTNPEIVGITMRDLFLEYKWNVVFGRMNTKSGEVDLPHWNTKLGLGDKIMVVGTVEDIQEVIDILGERAENRLSYDRSEFDVARIFVSNPYVVGKKISELNISKNYNAIITRIRRGDVELLATSNTTMELGDRVRFVARQKDLKKLSKFFGDSYQGASTINLFTFGLGIALGLLLGTIEFSLPGGITFKLGLAGGPIVVSLILGALQRTGPIVWSLPYSVNVTLRQIGLILLLATIGVQSGPAFIQSFSGTGYAVFLGGVIISLLSAFLILFIGYKLIKIPFSLLTGILSTQPAILEFALERSKNNLPLVGYTLLFPISLVLKIVYAQLLFIFLS